MSEAVKLVEYIIANNALMPDYPGSAVSRSVYDFSYTELGTILNEIHPFWQDFPMLAETDLIGLSLDGHNGFEEFVCVVLERLLTNLNAYVLQDGSEILDPARLHLLLECLQSDQAGSWEWVCKIREGKK